jgi:hypothetical protein
MYFFKDPDLMQNKVIVMSGGTPFNIASVSPKTAPEAQNLVKLNLFSKLFGETWACGRNWVKLRFSASRVSRKQLHHMLHG